jgi:hypothetical protein
MKFHKAYSPVSINGLTEEVDGIIGFILLSRKIMDFSAIGRSGSDL